MSRPTSAAVQARIDAIVDFAAGEYLFGPVYSYDLVRYDYPHRMAVAWMREASVWSGACWVPDCYTCIDADNFADALCLALAHAEQHKAARR